MYIYKKLILTSNGIMLDETRSLLQKALRRKERQLGLQAAKELLLKDQLPWKSIVTFLFEDHCLADTDVLMHVFEAYKEGTLSARFRCIKLLMECFTCRVNACLPVIALDYKPKLLDLDINVRDSLRDLVVPAEGCMRADLVLERLVRAWEKKDLDKSITYMKLATMVAEQEKRKLTQKGMDFLLYQKSKKVGVFFFSSGLTEFTVCGDMLEEKCTGSPLYVSEALCHGCSDCTLPQFPGPCDERILSRLLLPVHHSRCKYRSC